MKRLYYVRHGLSTANKLGVLSGGQSDHPLSEEGKLQAAAAGKSAKDLGIDLIISSTQTRAFQTAKIIASEINYPIDKIRVNSLFVERDFGELESTPDLGPEMLRAVYERGIKGSESDEAILKRAEEAYAWLEELPADNILVVSHGSFGRALRKVCIAEHDFEERIPNAQIVCWIE